MRARVYLSATGLVSFVNSRCPLHLFSGFGYCGCGGRDLSVMSYNVGTRWFRVKRTRNTLKKHHIQWKAPMYITRGVITERKPLTCAPHPATAQLVGFGSERPRATVSQSVHLHATHDVYISLLPNLIVITHHVCSIFVSPPRRSTNLYYFLSCCSSVCRPFPDHPPLIRCLFMSNRTFLVRSFGIRFRSQPLCQALHVRRKSRKKISMATMRPGGSHIRYNSRYSQSLRVFTIFRFWRLRALKSGPPALYGLSRPKLQEKNWQTMLPLQEGIAAMLDWGLFQGPA